MIDLTSRRDPAAPRSLKIIGIGGAGANVLDRMVLDGVAPAHLVAANTDAQALTASVAGEKIQLGRNATRGLGSGGDPDLGREAAQETAGEWSAALDGVDGVFLVVGLGGGTGSGAAPVIAEQARRAGALVVVFATLPFTFEGKRRAAQAEEALAALGEWADAVICFENDRMADGVSPSAGIAQAFLAADQTISRGIQAVAALLSRKGMIHLGFDDLKAALCGISSRCLFGYGEAEGDNRPFDALARALKNPLMDKGRMLRECRTVLIQVSGGADLTLNEVQLLMEELNRHLHERTRLLFGTAVDPRLGSRLAVTILSSVEGGAVAAPRERQAERLNRPVEAAAPIAMPQGEEEEPVGEESVGEEAVEEEPFEEAVFIEEEEEAPVAPEASFETEATGETQEEEEVAAPLVIEETQSSLFEEAAPEIAAPRVTRPIPGRTLRPAPKVAAQAPPALAEEPAPQEKEEPVEPPAPLIEPPARPLAPAASAPAPAPGPKAPQQETLKFEPVTRGRFEKSEPTIVDGQDLDVPTFLRRNIRVRP